MLTPFLNPQWLCSSVEHCASYKQDTFNNLSTSWRRIRFLLYIQGALPIRNPFQIMVWPVFSQPWIGRGRALRFITLILAVCLCCCVLLW